jgi:hypothetical protein
MKWKKFLEIEVKHPTLRRDLGLNGQGQGEVKDFVRTKVDYIAFRPFESLDLLQKSSSSSDELQGLCDSISGSRTYNYVEFALGFHIRLEEDWGTRVRHVDASVGSGSIQAHIDDVLLCFEHDKKLEGKQPFWECITKRTLKGSLRHGLTSMILEIYQFPRHYGLFPIKRSVETVSGPKPDYTHSYYSDEKPPGPIIPGTLKSAW